MELCVIIGVKNESKKHQDQQGHKNWLFNQVKGPRNVKTEEIVLLLKWFEARGRVNRKKKKEKQSVINKRNTVGRSDFTNFLLLLYKCVNLLSPRSSQRKSKSTSFKTNDLRTNLNDSKILSISVFKSDTMVLALIISILLLRQSVEPNPGPCPPTKCSKMCNFSALTFNVNGLGDTSKLRRILTKANDVVKQGGIFMMQETHLVSADLIKMYWKGNYVMSNYKTNSAGVLTLYGNEYKTLYNYSDEIGRRTMTVIESSLIKLLIVNIYVPNNHGEAISFIEATYLKILEILNEHPDSNIIIGGDMNVCLTELDCLNRHRSNKEIALAESITNNNSICNLNDAFRNINKVDGYTWSRGQCYSRLDYIFISENITRHMVKAENIWHLEKSDHAAVQISFKLPNDPVLVNNVKGQHGTNNRL